MNEKKSSASAREIISRGTWVLIPFLQQKSHERKKFKAQKFVRMKSVTQRRSLKLDIIDFIAWNLQRRQG